MFVKSVKMASLLHYTVCVVDNRKLVLLKSQAVNNGTLSLETSKLEEITLSEDVFEMVGYTIDDK